MLVKVTPKWKFFIRLVIMIAFVLALHRFVNGKSSLFPEHLRAFMDETGLGQDAASEELHQRSIVSMRLILAASILSILSFFLLRERQKWVIVVIGEYLVVIVSVFLAIITYVILNNNGYGPGGFPF